jgi:hypothetical protein
MAEIILDDALIEILECITTCTFMGCVTFLIYQAIKRV